MFTHVKKLDGADAHTTIDEVAEGSGNMLDHLKTASEEGWHNCAFLIVLIIFIRQSASQVAQALKLWDPVKCPHPRFIQPDVSYKRKVLGKIMAIWRSLRHPAIAPGLSAADNQYDAICAVRLGAHISVILIVPLLATKHKYMESQVTTADWNRLYGDWVISKNLIEVLYKQRVDEMMRKRIPQRKRIELLAEAFCVDAATVTIPHHAESDIATPMDAEVEAETGTDTGTGTSILGTIGTTILSAILGAPERSTPDRGRDDELVDDSNGNREEESTRDDDEQGVAIPLQVLTVLCILCGAIPATNWHVLIAFDSLVNCTI